MRKSFLLLIALALFLSCKQTKPIDYVLLSGKIVNVASDSVQITDQLDKIVKKIKIKKDATFSDTIYNTNAYYNFSDGNEHTAIYLEDGYNLQISLDTKKFDESIFYTGKGSEENNFLAKKYLMDETLGTIKEICILEESLFLEKVDGFYEVLQNNLKNKAISESFRKQEIANLKYEYILKLQAYERYHAMLSQNPSFKVSDSFPDLMENTEFTNEDSYKNSSAYQQLAMKSFFTKAQKKAEKDGTLLQNEAIKALKEVKSDMIKNSLLATLSYQVSLRNENAKELYENIMAMSTDDAFKQRLKKKFESFTKLVKGAVSPVFNNYENYLGGRSSLADYKGKFIYIDVWATWCAPCKAEIPALKKLTAQYKGKDIVFLSISIDKKRAHQAWKEMIKEKEMKGVQLFADKDWKSKFVQDYGISGIPRFILIDKEGKIISANAPRPSDPSLLDLFKSNGI